MITFLVNHNNDKTPIYENITFPRTNRSIGKSVYTAIYKTDPHGNLQYKPQEALHDLIHNAENIAIKYNQDKKQFKV